MILTITAKSHSDLQHQLRRIDIAVPRITEGRTKGHTERWTVCRFLSTFSGSEILEYPLVLSHRDRPDFELTLGNKHVGVEVTSSMPPQYGKALAVRERYCPDAPIEPEFFSWDSPERTRKEIMEILKKSKVRLHGMGWVGDSVERLWALTVFCSIQTKRKLLNSDGYVQFERNWLLIYDSIPQAALDINGAMGHLMSHLADINPATSTAEVMFDLVFVETHRHVVAIEGAQWSVRDVRDLWSNHGS